MKQSYDLDTMPNEIKIVIEDAMIPKTQRKSMPWFIKHLYGLHKKLKQHAKVWEQSECYKIRLQFIQLRREYKNECRIAKRI